MTKSEYLKIKVLKLNKQNLQGVSLLWVHSRQSCCPMEHMDDIVMPVTVGTNEPDYEVIIFNVYMVIGRH